MTKNKKPTVAVTGASGFLGSELVQHFLDKDYTVVGLVRNPQPSTQNGLTYRTYDISKKLSDDLLKDVNLVIHTAYIKYNTKNPNAMHINIEGAKELLRVSRANKVSRNIFISTMSAHTDAESIYGKQKLAIEDLFSTKNDSVIRSGLIVGNGGIVREMATFMQTKHVVPLIGGGRQPLQIVAVYDLAHAIETIYVQEKSGKLVIATPQAYTYKEFYTALGKRLGIKFIFIPLPLSLLYFVVSLASKVKIPLSISTDNILGLKQLTTMDTRDDLESLHIELDDLDTALQKTKISKA